MALGPVIGRFFALVQFRRLIERSPAGLQARDLLRPRLMFATALLWGAVWRGSELYQPSGWAATALAAVFVTGAGFIVIYIAGLDSTDKTIVQARIKNLTNRFLNRSENRRDESGKLPAPEPL